MTTLAAPQPFGWLRSARFDLTFIVGVALLALASGAVVVAQPMLFPVILFLDLWLLGYHHVVSTFTRLSFDGSSFREHRFLVLGLPLVVLAVVITAAWALGGWILSTTYLYWQWFHYTRQSYGIAKVYGKKAGGQKSNETAPGNGRLMVWMLYAVPLWGILHRSQQAPETFLGVELRTLPVPKLLVQAAAVVALALIATWLVQLVRGLVNGRRLTAQTLYLLSHMVIFVVGYVVIADIDHGWLVLNVWHNAQYILFVWLFNMNRFRSGVEPGSRLLSFLSQRSSWPHYFLTCLLLSTVLYFGLEETLHLFAGSSTLPLLLVAYQTINFHHYVVDGLIWKIRKKPLRKNLGLS